jgi:hypothetical protein
MNDAMQCNAMQCNARGVCLVGVGGEMVVENTNDGVDGTPKAWWWFPLLHHHIPNMKILS